VGVSKRCLVGKGEERRKGGLRINASTKGSSSFLAVAAAAIGYVEGHHDPVSFFEQGDAGACLEDYAHVFMTFFRISLIKGMRNK
jgi:hypothetical protein